MSETKTYVFPESGSGGGSGMLGMLAPLLQKNGLDPNLLLAMNNKGNGGFGGDGGWFMWVIFLFFLFPLMGRGGMWGNNGDCGNGGGSGLGSIPNLINNDNGRELLMQAIQGNGQAINSLATNLNCSVGQIQQSINGVMSQIQGVGNQIGMSSQQIINAVQAGNCQIAQSIADCCCKTQNAITTMGYENRLSMCDQTNSLTNVMNQNTLALRDGNSANTQAILGKLDQIQNQALMDKLDAERAKSAALAAQLSQEHQTQSIQAFQAQTVAPVNGALSDLSARLAKIECGLPPTVSVPYPQLAVYNPEIARAAAFGAYAGDVAAARGYGC